MIKLLNKFLNNIAIRHKILIMLVMGILLPIIITLTLFSVKIVEDIMERQENLLSEALIRVEINLTDLIQVGENVSLSYFADERFNEIIKPLGNIESTHSYPLSLRNEVNNKIRKDLFSYDLFSDFQIYHSLEQLSTEGPENYIRYLSEEEKSRDWYMDMKKSNKDIMISTCDEASSICIVRRLNFYDYDSDLLSLLKLEPLVLREAVEDSVFEDYRVKLYLVDDKGNTIISNTGVPEMNLDVSDYENMNRPFTYQGFIEDWELRAYYNIDMIYNGFAIEVVWLIIPMVVVMFIGLILFYYVGHSISTRLIFMSDMMIVEDGNDIKTIDLEDSEDEIGVTVRSYNFIVRKITALIHEVVLSKEKSDQLLLEKTHAYDELEESNRQLALFNEEIRQQDIKIKDLIYKDSITGLDNRTAINLRIERAILGSNNGKRFAVGFIDIDNFKYINDTYGHDVGDGVIETIGQKFKTVMSETLTIGRFGGDEFLFLLEGIHDASDIEVYLKEVMNLLQEPLLHGNQRHYLTISIGVSIYPMNGVTREKLIKCSDMALYKAKDRGKNQYVFYQNVMGEMLEKKLQINRAIKTAMDTGSFFLKYQPIVEAATGQLKSLEALIRWTMPELSDVSPYDLIVNAEESGLIVELGYWIFREACGFIHELNQTFGKRIRISINISGKQILDKTFLPNLDRIVEKIGIDPKLIDLEMTETVLIDYLASGKNITKQLVSRGYGLSLDDFGTGYSSLSYFNELPLSKLKIDKLFIDKLLISRNTCHLVESMISIAHNKDVVVIAEGVEKNEQMALLEQIKCDQIQGYLISEPLYGEEVEKRFMT